MCVCVRACVRVCVYAYLHVCVCAFVCIIIILLLLYNILYTHISIHHNLYVKTCIIYTLYSTHIEYKALSLIPSLFLSFGKNLQIALSVRNPSSVTALKGHSLNSLCLSTRNRILPNLKTNESQSGLIHMYVYVISPL